MLLCAAACFFCGCAGGRASSGTVLTRTGFFFNTIVEVTIREYLRLASGDLAQGAMEALAMVGLERRLASLPQGLDTPLGSTGYPLSVGALPETQKPRERGGNLTSVLAGLENGEECVSLLLITPGSLNAMGDLLFFTRQGQVKRTSASDYDVKRSKFAAINLKDGDKLLSVAPAEEGADLLMITRRGMCIRFSLDDVPEMGRVSAGVKGMKVDEGDQVILACPIAVSDQIVLFTERGYGKRLMSAMFDAQGRAGKGVKSVYFNKSGSTGSYVAAAARISASRSFTVMQHGGLLTPLSSDDLPCQDLTDKGKPVVIAVLDDVVEDLIL